jgi:hypothetical protein
MQHATCGMQQCNNAAHSVQGTTVQNAHAKAPKSNSIHACCTGPAGCTNGCAWRLNSGAMHACFAVHMQAASCMLHQPSCSAASPSSAMERRVRSPSRFIDIWNTSLQSHASYNEKPCSTQPAVGNMQHEHAKCNIQRTACNTNVQTATSDAQRAACSAQWGPQGRDAR